jgi:nitrogen fixation NifU-like protein
MTEAVKGKTVDEISALIDRFHEMLTADRERAPDNLGKLSALAGVRQFPIRVKCATLAWHTLKAALDSRDDVVSTE